MKSTSADETIIQPLCAGPGPEILDAALPSVTLALLLI